MMSAILLLSLSFLVLPLQSFILFGNIRDTGGKSVPNVRVSLMDENSQTVGTVFADGSGRYEFKGLGTGRYTVLVDPVGTPYESRSQPLELRSLAILGNPTESVNLDVVLRPRKGEESKPASKSVFAQEVSEAARAEYKKGLKELERSRPEAGIAALKKGIELFPDYYDALELLGSEYVKRRQYDAALPILAHALEVNTNSFPSMYALGVALLNLNRPQDAIPWLQKAAALESYNPNVHMMLGLAYGKNNLLDKSEDSLRKAYEIGGERAAEVHLYLAGIYNTQSKYSSAIQELQLFLKEAKGLKDTSQIQKMIESLKAKQKSKN